MKRGLILAILLFSLWSRAQTHAPATYEISGRVADALQMQPLAHADIQILSVTGDLVQRMQTASDGVFRFNGITAGKYQLIGSRSGYLQQGLNQHEFFFTGVAVGPGKPSTGIVFRLQPEASISGRVVDTFGDPVAEATVTLFVQGIWNGVVQTTHHSDVETDDQGMFHFYRLLPGTYFVAVSAKPWYAVRLAPPFADTANGQQLDVAYPTTFYDSASDPDSASPVVLRAGDEAMADFTLAPVRAARVIVHSSSMGGVAGSIPLLGGFSQVVENNLDERPIDEHTMEIAGVPPGPLMLETQSYADPDNQAHSLSLNLGSGDSIDAGDLSSAPVARSLVVSLQSDTATSTANNFYLRDRSNGHIYSQMVAPNGNVAFSDLPPGSYEFAMTALDGYLGRVSATGVRVVGHTIEVGDAESARLKVELKHDGPDVPGVVLDGKIPHAGAMILLVPDGDPIDFSSVRRDQSDSDGTFLFHSVGPGRYTAVAIENGWDLEWMRPGVLTPYLAKGERVEIKPNSKAQVTLQLQQLQAR